MKKLTSILLAVPLALGLSYSQEAPKTITKNPSFFENAREIRINTEYIRTFYNGIYNGGDYGPGLVDYAEEVKKDSTKAKELIPAQIVSFYLLTKTGNDTIILDVNSENFSPHYFSPGVYQKGDAQKLIYLKDSLHPRVVLSIVKALVNENGDTLNLIKCQRAWTLSEYYLVYGLEGVNKPSQIRRIK